MQDQHLFHMGEKLLLITIERQTILIDGQVAGFVEVLYDREDRRSEARIWLYPHFRSLTIPVRRWVERTYVNPIVTHPHSTDGEIIRYRPDPAGDASPESEWKVGFRADRNYGYEVFLTDRLTGFLYPVHTSRNRRSAFAIKREIEQDLFVLSSDAFAEKWGLQRIGSVTFEPVEDR